MTYPMLFQPSSIPKTPFSWDKCMLSMSYWLLQRGGWKEDDIVLTKIHLNWTQDSFDLGSHWFTRNWVITVHFSPKVFSLVLPSNISYLIFFLSSPSLFFPTSKFLFIIHSKKFSLLCINLAPGRPWPLSTTFLLSNLSRIFPNQDIVFLRGIFVPFVKQIHLFFLPHTC